MCVSPHGGQRICGLRQSLSFFFFFSPKKVKNDFKRERERKMIPLWYSGLIIRLVSLEAWVRSPAQMQ